MLCLLRDNKGNLQVPQITAMALSTPGGVGKTVIACSAFER